MSALGSGRIAQRHRIPTTPVEWDVPRRSWVTGSTKVHREQAAIIEISVVGAGVVAPDTTDLLVGSRTQIYWNGLRGGVIVRRVMRYPGSNDLLLFGVDFIDNPSILAATLFEEKVGGRV